MAAWLGDAGPQGEGECGRGNTRWAPLLPPNTRGAHFLPPNGLRSPPPSPPPPENNLPTPAAGMRPMGTECDVRATQRARQAGSSTPETLEAPGILQSASISPTLSSASTNTTSAPRSAKAAARQRASSRLSAWRASVRATMRTSRPSSLASQAARMRASASPRPTTRLERTWPQDLGLLGGGEEWGGSGRGEGWGRVDPGAEGTYVGCGVG